MQFVTEFVISIWRLTLIFPPSNSSHSTHDFKSSVRLYSIKTKKRVLLVCFFKEQTNEAESFKDDVRAARQSQCSFHARSFTGRNADSCSAAAAGNFDEEGVMCRVTFGFTHRLVRLIATAVICRDSCSCSGGVLVHCALPFKRLLPNVVIDCLVFATR